MFGKIKSKAVAGYGKIRTSILRRWFDWRCRRVLDAPPATITEDGGFVVLTMTCHRDLIQYLVAIKSFTRYASPRKAYVLDDGSLTAKDKAILARHVPGIEILTLDDFSSASCPRGGCWERLLAVAELAKHDYVVQMDADILTRGEIGEVLDCVKGQASFVLSTGPRFRGFETMEQRNSAAKQELAEGVVSDHVQFLTELNLDKIASHENMKYIRGCAGFSGFAKQGVSRDLIERVSSQMYDAIGEKWAEWGSEQVMSNIVVANQEGSVVLPHPKYSNCYEYSESETKLIHFIGICRFTSADYASKAHDAVAGLLA